MPARLKSVLIPALVLLGAMATFAEETNAVVSTGSSALTSLSSSTAAPGQDAAASLFRVMGALVVVFSLFFGGVWFFRNWQRVLHKGQGGTHLKVVEVRSLGNKQNIVVVGYGPQRLLLGATPAGISLLTHLPEESVTAAETEKSAPKATPGFMEALQQVISRKGS